MSTNLLILSILLNFSQYVKLISVIFSWWLITYEYWIFPLPYFVNLLSDFTVTFHFHALEKEMAPHSSTLAWRIPGTAEPGGLPSMRSHRVGHDWSDLAAAAAAHIFPNFINIFMLSFFLQHLCNVLSINFAICYQCFFCKLDIFNINWKTYIFLGEMFLIPLIISHDFLLTWFWAWCFM